MMNAEVMSVAGTLGTAKCRDGDVDIWKVCLNRRSWEVRFFFETLSPNEQLKANRFRFAKDRDRYVVTRGTLRQVVGDYLNTEPGKVSFSYNQYGKPAVDLKRHPLRFNVSHSRDLALIAVTSGREVGIDVEFIDNELDVLSTAQETFSPSELSVLRALPRDVQTWSFFKGWTRQEAYLKGQGKGFSGDAEQLPFLLLNAERRFSFYVDCERTQKWSLMSLRFDPNYCAALAVEGDIDSVRINHRQETDRVLV